LEVIDKFVLEDQRVKNIAEEWKEARRVAKEKDSGIE